jgi:hypothetical protein
VAVVLQVWLGLGAVTAEARPLTVCRWPVVVPAAAVVAEAWLRAEAPAVVPAIEGTVSKPVQQELPDRATPAVMSATPTGQRVAAVPVNAGKTRSTRPAAEARMAVQSTVA